MNAMEKLEMLIAERQQLEQQLTAEREAREKAEADLVAEKSISAHRATEQLLLSERAAAAEEKLRTAYPLSDTLQYWKQRAETAEKRNREAMEKNNLPLIEQSFSVLIESLMPSFEYVGVSLRVSAEDHAAIRKAIAGARTGLQLLRNYSAPIPPADVAELHRECKWEFDAEHQRRIDAEREVERLRHENHNLNWAIGTEGYPAMYTEAEQAEADAAHAASLKFIEKMKERKSEFDRLKKENAELTRKLAEQQAIIDKSADMLCTLILCSGSYEQLTCNNVVESLRATSGEELTKLLEEARKQAVPEDVRRFLADWTSQNKYGLTQHDQGALWACLEINAMLSAAPQPDAAIRAKGN